VNSTSRRLLSLAALAALAAGRAAAVDPDSADRQASEILEALRDDRTVRAVKLFDAQLRAELPPPRLAAAWRRLVGTLGPLKHWSPDPGPASPGQRAWLLEMTSGRARAMLAFGEGGVEGLWLAAVPPVPAGTGAARSEDVAVGEPPLLLGGTLATPALPGRHPAALLLGPLGPLDRDGTSPGRKPMRDLAEALAGHGVATLRFDRRTAAWPEGPSPRLTVEREVIADAILALRQLHGRPEVDPTRVFVVGVGLGGTLAPEVAARAGHAAGAVLVSCPPHSWPLALLEQARAERPAGSAELLRLEREVEKVLGGRLGTEETFLGYPQGYWSELTGHDPATWVKRLGRAALVLRGERDNLVSPDDLRAFQRVLEGQPGVSLATAPGVDGLLLGKDDRIDPAAVKRIADFMRAAPPAPAEDPRGHPHYPSAPEAGRPSYVPGP